MAAEADSLDAVQKAAWHDGSLELTIAAPLSVSTLAAAEDSPLTVSKLKQAVKNTPFEYVDVRWESVHGGGSAAANAP